MKPITIAVATAMFATLMTAGSLLAASRATAAPDPCQPIRAACERAGFTAGGGAAGAGIKKDCLDPIVSGTGQPRGAAHPLPQVNPADVAACKSSRGGETMAPNSALPTPPIMPTPQPRLGGTDAPPRGIYVDSTAFPNAQAQAPVLNQALTQQSVDGLVLVILWSEIEPGNGVFEWQQSGAHYLDDEIAVAMRNGKKVELSIRADNPPSWVAAAGVKTGPFYYANKGGKNGCKGVNIAAPWDPRFLESWNAMLKAVAKHLRDTRVNGVSEYDAVSLLRLTGINMDSDELHLPGKEPPLDNDACVKPNVEAWTNAGYSPAALLQGWSAIVSAFNANFPGKYFSVAIIDSTYPFPPSDGSKKKGLSAAQNQPLLTAAHQILKERLVIQNNSLYENEPARAETVSFAQSLGTGIAFQTNLSLGPSGGASCLRSGGQCASWQDYLNLLNTGIYPATGMRALYIEVFAPNVRDFGPAILQAHTELFAIPPPNPKGINPCPQGVRYCK